MNGEILIENEFIRLLLDEHNGTVISFFNKKCVMDLISSREKAKATLPWRLKIQNSTVIDVINSFNYHFIKKDKARLTWKTEHDITLIAYIWLENDSVDAHFEIQVFNNGEKTILSVEYPIIGGIGKLGSTRFDDYLAASFATGFLFKNPYNIFKAGWHPDMNILTYPNGASMQFMAYYKEGIGGFYMASHDPYGTRKILRFFKNNLGFIEFSIEHQSWDINPSNDLVLGYSILLSALLEGNWYESAEKYRRWAQNQEWCSEGPLWERLKKGRASKWLLEKVSFCTFGISSSFDMSSWLNAYHNIVKRPIFHILGYDWIKGNFGGYEDWFPTKVHKRNLITIRRNRDYYALFEFPFFFNRFSSEWKDVKSYETLAPEYQELIDNASYILLGGLLNVLGARKNLAHKLGKFKKIILKSIPLKLKDLDRIVDMIQDFLGDQYISYKFGDLAYMCPVTDYWRNFIKWKDTKLAEDCKIDAFYYDIGLTQLPLTCYHPEHGHPKGSGRWFIKKSQESFFELKKATTTLKGKYLPQGTELISEVFIPCMDFYQARAEAGPCGIFENSAFKEWIEKGLCLDIPMFAYVYHEYGPLRLDGWSKLSKEFGEIFYWIASKVTLNGGLFELNYEYSATEVFPGMKDNPVYTFAYGMFDRDTGTTVFKDETHRFDVDKQKMEFLREITDARMTFGKDFLVYGRMIKPVKFDNPLIALNWYLYNQPLPRSLEKYGKLKVQRVIHAAWKYKDEKIGLFFVNITTRPFTISFNLKVKEHFKQASPLKAYYVTNKKKKPIDLREGEKLKIKLPARKIVMIEISGA